VVLGGVCRVAKAALLREDCLALTVLERKRCGTNSRMANPRAAKSAPLSTGPRRLGVLGTPLVVTGHAAWLSECVRMSAADQPVAVEFTNTQIVTMRRHEAGFRRTSAVFDFFVPDASPLVWCLNRQGAAMSDRVYGPAFMRHALENSPRGVKHYLLGGSEAAGRELTRRFPGANIVGAHHGRCSSEGVLEENDRVIREINDLSPDILWVGLGAPKQERWIERNKPRLTRGVVLSVGQAFDVNAGLRADAPAWMQRAGLTWLYRMASEPRRLIGRYVKWNSLFLWYLLWDGLRARAFATRLHDDPEP